MTMADWIQKLDTQLKRLGISPRSDTYGDIDPLQLISAEITLESVEDWQGNVLHDPNTGALLNAYGNTIVVYIKDNTFGFQRLDPYEVVEKLKDYEKLKKVHLTWCGTLQHMEKSNRYDRYTGIESRTNEYTIEIKNGTTLEDRNTYLRPCITCLKKVGFIDPPYNFNTFHIRDWFEYCDRNNAVPPKKTRYTPETYPPSEYTGQYQKIARTLKQRHNYICQECGDDYSQNPSHLDCHHINGVKGDNKSSNLRILCVPCHKKQPLHGHYDR